MLHNKELSLNSANSLTQTIQSLDSSLKRFQPNNSELTQTITYTLIATALVGIMVYHYIKSHEESRSQEVLINSAKQNSSN
jgi:hypothetical protein